MNKKNLLILTGLIKKLITLIISLVFSIVISVFIYFNGFSLNFNKNVAVERMVHSEIQQVTNVKPIIKDGIDVESGFIVDEGYEIVKVTCTRCHTSQLVTQNKATREGWLEMIRWMQKTQGLWDLGANEKVILDYLEKNYSPATIGRRKPLPKPTWYILEE